MKVQLVDEATGGVIGESALPREEIKDFGYTRFALKAETEPGKTYTIRIMTDGTTQEGLDSRLLLYRGADGSAEEKGGKLNGEPQPFDWVVMTEYDPE